MAEMDLDDILASALDDMDSDSSDEEPGEPITAPMVATEAPLPNTAGPAPAAAPQPAAENPEDAMKEIMAAFQDPSKLAELMQEAGLKDEDGQLGEEFKTILDALGQLDLPEGNNTPRAPLAAAEPAAAGLDANLAETLNAMQSNMDDLGAKMGTGAGGMEGLQGLLGNISEEEMAQMGDMLKGVEENGDLQGMLENMMSQMLSAEVLLEPMKEMDGKYIEFLKQADMDGITKDEMNRFRRQHVAIQAVVEEFEKGDEANSERVGELLQEVQNHGDLPPAVMEST